MSTNELQHKKRRRAKRRCRMVCKLRIPIIGICLSKKRKCSRRKRR